MKHVTLLGIFLLLWGTINAQLPSPALVGYWHNWNLNSAPYIALDQIDPRYNVIEVSFAVPQTGTSASMVFTPSQATQAAFIAQIQTLQSQGKKVLISMGGANAHVAINNTAELNAFVSSMGQIINTYGFDGMDIDLEGSSVSVTGGSIANPTDVKVINLIDGIKRIMANYQQQHGKKLLLTMAPETAYVQGGMSAYTGIWGAYLPIIEALKDSIDLLQVQLYNTGSVFGLDGNIYNQGTADFIVAMGEAVIRGFTAVGNGGLFSGLSAGQIAIGLPSCPSAAPAGGYTSPSDVRAAINYLRGNGAQPGSYTLVQSGGYPTLAAMMTWSINWDAVTTCNNVAYEYADNFQQIFGNTLPIHLTGFNAKLRNRTVALAWTIEEDDEAVHYEIEHSKNGIEFEIIGKVDATNNYIQPAYYQYIHEKPTNGANYYRLRMLNIDGVIEYSKLIHINLPYNEQKVTFFPNPVRDILNIRQDIKANYYQIINAQGLVVQEGTVPNNHIIATQYLPEGAYVLLLDNQINSFIKTK